MEAYEFAYDAHIRSLNRRKTVLEFLAVLVAVVFLFLQYIVKEREAAHAALGYVGTALSLAVILMVIWGHMDGWPRQIEKKRELSALIREMLVQHGKIADSRPIDEAKIRKWLVACEGFEEKRKHEMATVPALNLKRGFQHVGNTHPTAGLKCTKCDKVWTPESNARARWSWVPFFGCDSCGV